MPTTTTLITAEEYAAMPDPGYPTELVRGEIVRMNQPYPRHGQVCGRVDRILGNFVDEHELGHCITNDAGVVTEHDPDTIRGGNVWYISFQKIPKGPFPNRTYLDVPPDIVVEVLSPSNTRSEILQKTSEYLEVGVAVVCVLDSDHETAHLYYPESPDVILSAEDELTFPDQLPGFNVLVKRFFE